MNSPYMSCAISSITPSADVDNVIDFSIKSSTTSSPFDKLTVRLIIAQHWAGTLQEGVLLYLLAGVGLRP
jgi:hypothetical protein